MEKFCTKIFISGVQAADDNDDEIDLRETGL
jgi:hypothetical protein